MAVDRVALQRGVIFRVEKEARVSHFEFVVRHLSHRNNERPCYRAEADCAGKLARLKRRIEVLAIHYKIFSVLARRKSRAGGRRWFSTIVA